MRNASWGSIAFRVDASLEIGSGHVMRCLTLANALRKHGAKCHFLCREHPGHLIEIIEAQGFHTHRLPRIDQVGQQSHEGGKAQPAHAHWLGGTWKQDAEACRPLLAELAPDWLVVDHYALDVQWEVTVLPVNSRMLVIDDLADRAHQADILLDQNLGRHTEDYHALVPASCRVLAGPRHALLRPEFANLREHSLARRARNPELRRLLISLGGVDKDNITSQVLDALRDCKLPENVEITVVMGAAAPWCEEVTAQAGQLPWPTEVVVNVNDIARRMAEADLAISAAGSTSWERCCLGLPTLMLVLAENQSDIAKVLHEEGAAWSLGRPDELTTLSERWVSLTRPEELARQSAKGAALVDGQGIERFIQALSGQRQPESHSHD